MDVQIGWSKKLTRKKKGWTERRKGGMTNGSQSSSDHSKKCHAFFPLDRTILRFTKGKTFKRKFRLSSEVI